MPTMDRAETIRALNDLLRTRGIGGKVVVTRGVHDAGPDRVRQILVAVMAFNEFTDDNDPYREHDFGTVELEGERYFWKIDYYDTDLCHGSPDPADPAATSRVLTIMRADEY